MQHKILVTGATGTVGSQLVSQLHQAGHHVRALTRNPAKANFPPGVEVVAGNLAEPQTLVAAMEGITALHLINFDGATFGNLQTGQEIVDLARKAGVQRVTVLMGGETGTVEEAVAASDLSWTFLQPVEFMANMLEWAEPIRAGVERLAAAVGAHHQPGARLDVDGRVQGQGGPGGDGQVALAPAQALGGEVDGDERGGAGGVDREGGAHQVELVRDAPGGHAGHRALPEVGVGERGSALPFDLEPPVLEGVHEPDHHGGAAAGQARGRQAGVLQALPHEFEQEALVGVHAQRLAR